MANFLNWRFALWKAPLSDRKESQLCSHFVHYQSAGRCVTNDPQRATVVVGGRENLLNPGERE